MPVLFSPTLLHTSTPDTEFEGDAESRAPVKSWSACGLPVYRAELLQVGEAVEALVMSKDEAFFAFKVRVCVCVCARARVCVCVCVPSRSPNTPTRTQMKHPCIHGPWPDGGVSRVHHEHTSCT